MSTAQKTKSTMAASASLSAWASRTMRDFASSGMGVGMAQRAPTASSYRLPADRALAATAVSWNQGCRSSRDTNRWPTIPVAPTTPTAYCFIEKTS